MIKKCVVCDAQLISRQPGKPGRLKNTCSDACHAAKNREKERRWREANPERARQYYEANRKAISERRKRRRAANPGAAGAYLRRWREARRNRAALVGA